nr:hypothetical protein [Candidatus Prometheoarchaeum syntrophicum]QEE15784.1 Tetratricopeptide repeat protein [Candidatus Prometheoarchaeum syntrophicum]
MSSREKIDLLLIEADLDIQEKKISSGLQKLEIAKHMATELGWDERVRTIKSMIEEVNKKVKIQEERARKQKEIEQKKLENKEKEKQLEAARQRLQDRKTAEKNQKLEALRKKKEIEEKLSNEAYDLLETGSKALLKDDYQLGIDSFTKALENFKNINWSAEVNRTLELLNDARNKFQNYKKKLKDDERKAEKVWEAQKETQKTIELSRKLEDEKKRLQESIEMEHKKEELLKKAKSDKALSLLDEAIQFRNLNQFDLATNAYKEALEIFKKIGWQKEANEVQEEISLTIKQREKLKSEKKKLEENLMKKRLDEEAIEKLAKESQQLRESKEKEEREKRQRELEILSQKEAKLKEVLSNISKIEDVVNYYENQVHLGKILSLECPYPNAIRTYGEGSKKLRDIGYFDQADRLADGENTYKQKIFEDEKLRVEEKKRLEKIKQDEEEIEKKAKEAQILRDEKLRIEKEKRQKELEELSKKESRLKDVLKDISIIEEVISGYESRVGLGKILSLECPYPKAVELYYIGTNKLREIGLIEQADRLEEGGKTYKLKITEDEKLRELEKQRLENIKQEKEEIERKAKEAQKLRDEELNRAKAKRQNELEKLTQKDNQLKEILAKISEMEEAINIMEQQGDFTEAKNRYSEAIELYRISSEKLSEIGFHEHSKLLKDGEVSYKQKLLIFERNQEEKRKHLEYVQKQEEEVEQKAKESLRIKEEKEKEQRERRQKELEAISQKESQLKDVLGDISIIEDVVNEYAREVGLGKILFLECPYPKAVELYNIGTKKLREAGLIEQANRLDEGRKTYESKILEDKKIREREKKRIEKARLDEDEIERKAEEAQRIQELKEKELRDKRQKELEAISQKESKLKDVLGDISKIEDVVNDYAKGVGLGKILSLKCPYPKAVELYNIGTKKLREAGLIEQADRLDDGRKTYERKIEEDKRLREREIQRIEKTLSEKEELERKAEEAQRIQELKEKELRDKRQKELEAISQKESKLKDVLGDISKIEDVVNDYAKGVGLGKILSLKCPYPKAVELYNIGTKKLREAGLIEQADRLDDGRKTYERKIEEDKRLREREIQRIEKTLSEKEELERKAEEAQRIQELKEKELRDKRQKELEAISQKESKLKDVLGDISKIEDVVNDYAKGVGLGKILSLKCPYPKAVELYNIGTKKLREAGLIEQADRLDDGRKTYERKIEEDKGLREREIQRIEKYRLGEEEIEIKAKEAQRLIELKEQELREKRQKELETLSKKESKLKNVLGDLSKIEDVVNVYVKEVGLGKILSLECPYPKAVELYKIGTIKLREAGLIEQADRLDEGRKTYEQKIIEDKRLREREIQRIEKYRLGEEEIEIKAKEAQRLIELKDQELREKRQKELKVLSKKESKLKNVLGDLSKIEDVVNVYVKEVGLGKILSLECPYPKAVELYKTGTIKLREAGLIEQADRLDEGRKTYERKIIEDEKHREREIQRIEKYRLGEEEIEIRAKEAQRLIELKEKELREKRQKELEVLSKKESKLKNVLGDLSKIEDVVNAYIKEVGLGKILSLECPYPKAVELYKIGTIKLREAGLIEQADRLDEGRKTYERKIIEDLKHREREFQRIEKARLDEEEIERKAEEAQRIKELKEQELREKRQKELEVLSKKESKLKNVLGDLSKIEDVVNAYVKEVGLGKILSLECPYPKAVELYKTGTIKLREAGLIEQADRLDEGRKTYERKIIEDLKHREREFQRIEKARLDEEEIERKAEEAQRIKELKEQELREKRQKELEVISQKESRLKDVLGDISKIEDVVSEYAKGVSLGNILSLECPYPKAVELYNIGTNKLREIGLIEQADRLDEGRKTYEQKIIEDKDLRDLENQKKERARLEKEEFEKKTYEAQRLKELKEQELREKRQKELEVISQKESRLKDVLGDISKIEDVVNEYSKEVSLGKILSLECPYPKAVELYNIGTNKLREIGLIEQADRLDEGRKIYEKKIIEDKRLRDLEKQRLTKIEIDREKLEMQAQVAAKLKEIKLKEKGEQKKKEQEKLSSQREILTEALSAIEKIEKQVKKYEDQVGLGKMLLSKCPYSIAIEVYKTGSEKLKEIGLLEQSARLNDGYLLYKDKLIFDEKNRKFEEEKIRKDQLSKLELEQQILNAQKQKEAENRRKEEEKAAIQNKYQNDQNKANKAFNLMDEGNKLAANFKFDEAIEKFQEAMDILDEIKWLAELDKVLLQISIFRKQKDQKELEKIEEEELKIKKQKEIEEMDQKAKLSWEKKFEEERKRLEIEQSKTEEKRSQWELEFQRKIEEDRKKREIEEQKRLEQFQREQEIGLIHQNVYNDCLNLLDQAKTLVTEQQFEPAINIYKNVVEKYNEINYSEGIRLTNESILKVQKLWDDHNFDIEIAQKSLKEREEEEKRLERLISESKQKDERNRLLAEQKKLKTQLEKEKVTHIQNEIISILEIAGDLTNNNQFDKALEYYDKSIELFKKIDWDLKYKQVLSIVQDVKAKKKHFIKLEKQLEEQQKKDEKAQKAFKDFLEKQEAERKSKGEKVKELTEQQQVVFNYRVTLEDAAYEYIDQAEKCVKGRKFYLSLYYFHYALNNFIEIEWVREAKALKKRFLQVYNLITNPLMDINEILNNPKLDLEYHFANSLSLILLAQKRKDFLVAQTEMNTVSEMAKNLKWPKSLKLLDDFKEVLEQEKEEYRKEIEMKKYAPTESKALKVMKEASGNIKNNNFEEGLELANKAKEIYIQLGNEKEARKVEQEMLRWKLKYTRHQLNQQRQESRSVESEKKTFLSENERKNLIIEERKKRRREARKKLLGD